MCYEYDKQFMLSYAFGENYLTINTQREEIGTLYNYSEIILIVVIVKKLKEIIICNNLVDILYGSS